MYMCVDFLFIHYSTDRYLSCFHIFGYNTTLNPSGQISVQVPAFNSFGYIPRSGTAGSYDNSIFNFLRDCHTVSYSSCTILHSHQQCTGFEFLHILTNTVFCFLIEVILMPVRSYIFIFMSLFPTFFTY